MRPFLLRQFATAFLVLAAVACDSSTGPGGALVSASVSHTTFRAGDSVVVSVTTTNLGPDRIWVPTTSCLKLFEVLKDDTVVLPNSAICALANSVPPSTISLRAGASTTVNYVWHAQHDGWPVLFSPGTYTLRGRVYVRGQPVYSEPVSIEILP